MAHYYKDENGVKHRVAGLGLIDRVLNLTSHHAIANDVVTAELNSIKDDVSETAADMAEVKPKVTWEHTNTVILSTVTNPSGTYNINTEGFKSICVRGTFSNGGGSDNIISLDELKSLPNQTYIGTVTSCYGSQGAFGGVIGYFLTPTTIKIDGKWVGSSVSSHNLTVHGLN